MSEASLKYRRILVTGAGGFVGRHLMPKLHTRATAGTVIVAAQRGHGNPEADRHVDLDITDAAQVHRIFAELDPDLIVHLAGQSSISQQDAEIETWRVNVCGTINIAAAIAAQPRRADLLFASSAEVYGLAFREGRVTEDSLPIPLSVYGRTKLAAEQALTDIAAGDGNRVIIVRPSNHSGAGQDERFVIPSFAGQIARVELSAGERCIKVGNLEAERDFLDVRDVVDGYVALLASQATVGGQEIYNLASGKPVPIQKIVDHLRALSKNPIRLKQDPARLRQSDIPHASLSVDRLQSVTAWRPSYTLEQTLADVLAAARQTIAKA